LVATLISLDKTVGIFNRHLAIGGTVTHNYKATPWAVGLILSAFYVSAATAAQKCSVENIQALAPMGTTIKSAEPTATPVPHCKIDGQIITTNPGPNQVNFRLQLPDRAQLLFADPKTGTVSGIVVPPAEGAARDFLLCPYPKIAKFNGKKAGEFEAGNWSCRASRG
jgi:hypothetical protein